jgi:hypothetical protein
MFIFIPIFEYSMPFLFEYFMRLFSTNLVSNDYFDCVCIQIAQGNVGYMFVMSSCMHIDFPSGFKILVSDVKCIDLSLNKHF